MGRFDPERERKYPASPRLSPILIISQKMASNLTDQVCSISEVTKAVTLGGIGKLVNVDVQGEMLDLKMTVAVEHPRERGYESWDGSWDGGYFGWAGVRPRSGRGKVCNNVARLRA
jgi:hypothetical protein